MKYVYKKYEKLSDFFGKFSSREYGVIGQDGRTVNAAQLVTRQVAIEFKGIETVPTWYGEDRLFKFNVEGVHESSKAIRGEIHLTGWEYGRLESMFHHYARDSNGYLSSQNCTTNQALSAGSAMAARMSEKYADMPHLANNWGQMLIANSRENKLC